MRNKITFFVTAMFFQQSIAVAQIPVEVLVGHKKTTVDILFFKFFKNKEGKNSRFLFFNRNRASIDHTMTSTTNLPQFGFTEAISYNTPALKGFAPVAVASILNRGIYPKAGVQYASIKKNYTLFAWAVAETVNDPNVDVFFLGRYTPQLTQTLHLFAQLELVQAFPTGSTNNFTFIQRARVGLKQQAFQYGMGLDLSQTGRNDFVKTDNFGGFFRYEF
jgi:hypothetical protein